MRDASALLAAPLLDRAIVRHGAPQLLHDAIGQARVLGREQALAAFGELLKDPRVRIVTVTEHNPLHGASDGSDTQRLANALAAACATL